MPTTINPSGQTITQFNALVGGATNLIANVGPGTSGQILQSAGNASNPAYSTSTYPTTNAASTLLYASSANTMGALATANNGMLVTSSGGVPSILAGPGTTGNILQSNAAAAPSFSTATYPPTATSTGTILRADGTNWSATTTTYPNTNAVSTLLYASASNVMSALSTANGGVLITSNTGVPSILAGSGTSGQILQAVSGAAPAWSTPTYPSASGSAGVLLRSDGTNYVATTTTYPNTNALNTILYASSANVMSALATATNGILITDGTTGIPSISSTLPSAVQGNITSAGAVTLTSVNFGGTTLSNYVEGTWTPTLTGSTVAGTTTYSTQSGQYTRIGNTVIARFNLVGTAATGTGNALLGGLPLTPNNVGTQVGAVQNQSNATWVFPAGTTNLFASSFNSTTATLFCSGSATTGSALQMANAAFNFKGCFVYQL